MSHTNGPGNRPQKKEGESAMKISTGLKLACIFILYLAAGYIERLL